MPQVGIQFGGEKLTWDEARKRAEDINFPYPPPLIEAMADQRDDQTPTASTILGCLRQFELKRRTEYYAEGHGELPSLFGTAWHDLMDRYRKMLLQEGELAEGRIGTMVDNIPFSGKPDFFSPGKIVSDWKSKLYIPVGFKPPAYHIGQVNIYNWLAYKQGLEPAPRWELVYVTQSWVQRESGETQPVRAVGEYVAGRLREWGAHATAGTLPPPVPELFQSDAKGKPLPPCAWCPVREACLAELKNEQGEKPF